jgi:MYXO-CTERM domain-containing protein
MRTANRLLIGAGLALALASRDARGDGVAAVMTAKSIPPATVAVIDPEGGSSGGGGTTDVRVGPGDIILFRFNYFPVPSKILHGLQGYLTEYVPANTEVVGMRLIDDNDLTIPPNLEGIADDSCGRPCSKFNSVPCNGTTCNLDDGSISQVYADTGIFYTTDGRIGRNPNNAFLTLKNGILMNPEPNNSGSVKPILETSSPIYAHQSWDWIQVRAYGTGTAASGNNGTGNSPFHYGSPVAGSDTYYNFEATEVSPGTIEFNDVVGPWQRISYPGSQIGSGSAATAGNGTLKRMGVDTGAGFDVTPNTPLPASTKGVRVAMGEVRVGNPGRAEVALRVLATPLDPTQNKDADCAEVFGGDTSASSPTGRARDNAWPTYLGSPACVFLNLLFDHTVDKTLALNGDTLTFTIHGKNLSINPQTNVVVRQKYDHVRVAFVSATGGATLVGNCDGDGYDCVVWPAMSLQPSDEYTFNSAFTVQGGSGHDTNVSYANYRSDQLPAPGFTTQTISMVQGVAVVGSSLQCDTASAPAGGTAGLSGTVRNDGSASGSYDTMTILLPTGWSINGNVTLNGTILACSSACGTNQPEYQISSSFAAPESRALAFSVNVPAATATDLYPVDLQIWASQSGFGGQFETYFRDAAFVPVGQPRSAPPAINCPISSGATSISGTTTEPDGTIIRLYFNGIERGSAVASGGTWTVTGFAGGGGTFGQLYGGLEVRATADGPAAQESLKSAACFATTVPVCSDFIDNDGDGLTDFPADPGCDSPTDSDETNPVYECSDGVDNDLDGFTDYPADISCSDPTDNDESGPPQCSDGIDNDGDGLTDFPADPGCTDANDPNEINFAACEDGVDNDLDGLTDFPADPGCHSANDNDETDPPPFNPLTDDIRARLLIAFDTSGSMNWNTCNNTFTGGDGSQSCPGSDVGCVTCNDQPGGNCGNGAADDSRIYKVKGGVSDAVSAYGEVDFGLMRFHQRPVTFVCPTTNASRESGGWQGGGAAPCSGGFNSGDLLVGFAGDNTDDLLQYMDGQTNYPGTPPPGQDRELRASGTTPLGGILTSAQTYIDSVRAGDPVAACRPYRVILVTDGAESCGGDPVSVAAALCTAGIPTDVIGFSTADPTIQNNLNAIADAGCGATCDPDYLGPNQVCRDTAVFADDSNALSAAIGRVVSSSILRELCNGLDDNCNGLIDEDYPGVFPAPGAACDNGQLGACNNPGNIVCLSPTTSGCNAPPGTPTPEVCDGIDNDCNGIIDDGVTGCGPCIPATEICNGVDDNCNGQTDESPLPGEGNACGVDTGECVAGTLQCVSGALHCVGDTGPAPEICNNLDDNCDGITDGFSQACYDIGDGGCTLGVGCTGECRIGIQTCTSGSFGVCLGEVGRNTDICNGLDDDCDGLTDEDFPSLGMPCDNGLLGICLASGSIVCTPNGLGTECDAPILNGGIEVCNDVDDDCDGSFNEGLGPPVGGSCGGGMCGGTVQCVCDPFPPAPDDHTNCALACVGGGSGTEVCDNVDNDCNGFTDEGPPSFPPLPGTGGTCKDYPENPVGECQLGVFKCIDGMIVCDGDVGPNLDGFCNNKDDNCDGLTDNNLANDDRCAEATQLCYQGQCLDPCDPTVEFPCTGGRFCLTLPGGADHYCFLDPCRDMTCDPGTVQERVDAETCNCVNPCADVVCGDDQICEDGLCVTCNERPAICTDQGKVCALNETHEWVCVPNACENITCTAPEYCVDGQCVGDCDPACAEDELCTQGTCCAVDDTVCENIHCQRGLACNPDDGSCIADPCVQAVCAEDQECKVGCGGLATCVPKPTTVPVHPPQYVLITGEGGCGCRIGGGPAGRSPAPAGMLLGLVLVAAGVRRRRTR